MKIALVNTPAYFTMPLIKSDGTVITTGVVIVSVQALSGEYANLWYDFQTPGWIEGAGVTAQAEHVANGIWKVELPAVIFELPGTYYLLWFRHNSEMHLLLTDDIVSASEGMVAAAATIDMTQTTPGGSTVGARLDAEESQLDMAQATPGGSTVGARLDAITTPVDLRGPGADNVTITVTGAGGSECWITSDASGSIIVAGVLTLDDAGSRVFMLDDGGVYYLWMRGTGVNPISGQQFVAQKD